MIWGSVVGCFHGAIFPCLLMSTWWHPPHSSRPLWHVYPLVRNRHNRLLPVGTSLATGYSLMSNFTNNLAVYLLTQLSFTTIYTVYINHTTNHQPHKGAEVQRFNRISMGHLLVDSAYISHFQPM